MLGGGGCPEELKPAPYGSATARTEATSKAVSAAVRFATATAQASTAAPSRVLRKLFTPRLEDGMVCRKGSTVRKGHVG